MEIGKYNILKVSRMVDFGAYLADDAGSEVLLPAKYITDLPEIGSEIEVFVYRDSDDRPVAVTEHPYATVGEFAFLRCVATGAVGAFLDWGLPKDLLVPHREQRSKMHPGGEYLVYIYLDHASGRIAASAKVEKYLGNLPADYRCGTSVSALVTGSNDVGYTCIVDNLHRGILYHNELHAPLTVGQTLKASVKNVREDGKIDLVAGGSARERSAQVADEIERRLKSGGTIGVTERSAPEEIERCLHCSKKDFKKGVGHLLKSGKVTIGADGAILLAQK